MKILIDVFQYKSVFSYMVFIKIAIQHYNIKIYLFLFYIIKYMNNKKKKFNLSLNKSNKKNKIKNMGDKKDEQKNIDNTNIDTNKKKKINHIVKVKVKDNIIEDTIIENKTISDSSIDNQQNKDINNNDYIYEEFKNIEFLENDNENENEEKKFIKFYNKMLLNLKIISQIKINDKLKIDKNLENIQIDLDIFQSLFRTLNNDSRVLTIETINKLMDKCFELIEYIKNKEKKEKNINNKKKLQRILNSMILSIKGLENLKVTYKSDRNIVTNLDLLIENINIKIIELKQIFQINMEN